MTRTLAGLVVLTAGLAYGACAPAGKLCTPDGQQGNNPTCCAPLFCPSAGPSKNHCSSEAGPNTSTTIVGTPGSTTTTLPPVGPSVPAEGLPLRFSASDVGWRFRASQEMLWNPATGRPANQYMANIRASTRIWIYLPEVLRLLRDTPGCGLGTGINVQLQEMPGKVYVLYSIRDIQQGDPYFFHGNYLWDRSQALFSRARSCVPWASVPDALKPLLASGPPPMKHLPFRTGHENDGLADPRIDRPPLNARQCELLEAAHAAHEKHAQHLLAHDPNASDYVKAVVDTQFAVEAAARTIDEQMIFNLTFTGVIDPAWPQEWVDWFTHETSRYHHQWAEAFHCATGERPDFEAIWENQIGHARAHFMRAIYLPKLKLRKPCGASIGTCPISAD